MERFKDRQRVIKIRYFEGSKMSEKQIKIVNFRNIAYAGMIFISFLLVIITIVGLGLIAGDMISPNAYLLGFVSCMIVMLIVFIFEEFMKMAERPWKKDLKISEEK